MKTFLIRTLTAAVFAVIMLSGLLWSPMSFFLLFFCIGTLTLWEFLSLARKLDPRYGGVSMGHRVLALAAGAGMIISFSGHLLWVPARLAIYIGWCVFFGFLILIVLNEFLNSLPGKWARVGYSLFGLIYISIPSGLMIDLRLERPYHGFPLIPLGLVLLIWINDTMAYIVGSLIGSTPFFPSISPKKTWEGTGGGALLTLVAAGLFGWLGHYYRVGDWIALGAIVAVMGTIGDLFESALKRLAGVKDSGKIMPGHGGFLDRFDSLLFVIPFAWIYAVCLL